MSEHTKTFSPDVTRDTHTTASPDTHSQRQPAGLTPQALAILDHLSRSPDLNASLLHLQRQDPALYAEALRAISATQGNSAVNDRLDTSAAAPSEGPSRTERAHRGRSAEATGKNKAAFASIFDALKPEAAPKPKLSEILSQSDPVPLPQRARLEAALCRDLSEVRAYQGTEVSALLAERQAQAAAIGQYVLLGANPTLETIAEEVIHTCQQAPLCGDDLARVDDLPNSQPSDATEVEAKGIAAQIVDGQPTDPIKARRGAHFAKQDAAGEGNTKTGHWEAKVLVSSLIRVNKTNVWSLTIRLPKEFKELDVDFYDVWVASQKLQEIENLTDASSTGERQITGWIPGEDVQVQRTTSAYITDKGKAHSGQGPEILPKPVEVCVWDLPISRAEAAQADNPSAGISVKINKMEDIAAYAGTLTGRGNGPPLRIYLLGAEGHHQSDGSYYFPDLTMQRLGVKDEKSADPLTAGEGLKAQAVVLVSSEDAVCPRPFGGGPKATRVLKVEVANTSPEANFWELSPVQAAVTSDISDAAKASEETLASRDAIGASTITATTVTAASVLLIDKKPDLIAAIEKAMNGRDSKTFSPHELWQYDVMIIQLLLFYLQKPTENGPTDAQLKSLYSRIKSADSSAKRDPQKAFPDLKPCISYDVDIEVATRHVQHRGGQCIETTENMSRVEKRMRDLNVDQKHIGIKTDSDENGRGYDERPEKNQSPGVNVLNDGIVLYHYGLRRASDELFSKDDYPGGFPEWDIADTFEREDAVIAHEYVEMKTSSHHDALTNAMNYPGILPGAKHLLEAQQRRDNQ
jgi:hypothetical protein